MPTNRRARARPGDAAQSLGERSAPIITGQRQLRRPPSATISVLVLCLLFVFWRQLSALRVTAQLSQPPDNIGHNARLRVADYEPDVQFLAPAVGIIEEGTRRRLLAADNLDIFGPYLPDPNRSANGAPVYAKRMYINSFVDEDIELCIWYVRSGHVHGQWYIGPKDRIDTNYGIAKADVVGWGAGGVPALPSEGWHVADVEAPLSAPVEDRWHRSSLSVLGAAEYENLLAGGAFRVLAPSDMDGGRRTFEFTGMSICGRPRYDTKKGDRGKRLSLWWHEEMESWCVGPAKDAERNGLQLSTIESWQYCHLRSTDPAVLPEWIHMPWQAMEPRWRTYTGTETPKVKRRSSGQLMVGMQSLSFSLIPGQVEQLPQPSGVVTSLYRHRNLLRLAVVLIAIAIVATRHLEQISQAWTSILASAAPAGRRRAAQAARRGVQQKRRPAGKASASTPAGEPGWLDCIPVEYHDALTEAAEHEQPAFICPLTKELMRTPVMLCKDGVARHSYEHSVIYKWIVEEGNLTEPNTNETLPPYGKRTTIVVNQVQQREIRAWAEAKVAYWQAEERRAPARPERAPCGVHVFVDHSNIHLGAPRADGGAVRPLNLAKLAAFAEGGREAHQRVVIGSQTSDEARQEWEKLHYTVVADRRRGKERFVDDALHAQLMQAASKTFAPPRVLALLTGDGNANEGRTTFPDCVERALQNSWHVELISWRSSTNRIYEKFEREYGDYFHIRYLDGQV